MTLQEFIETRPQSYGRGNINLLYSSSVSGSDDVPIPPFHIQGLFVKSKEVSPLVFRNPVAFSSYTLLFFKINTSAL